MSVVETPNPVYVAECDECARHGPWAETKSDALRYAKDLGWSVRRKTVLSESKVKCAICKTSARGKVLLVREAAR